VALMESRPPSPAIDALNLSREIGVLMTAEGWRYDKHTWIELPDGRLFICTNGDIIGTVELMGIQEGSKETDWMMIMMPGRDGQWYPLRFSGDEDRFFRDMTLVRVMI
jgi:hypothetical protein